MVRALTESLLSAAKCGGLTSTSSYDGQVMPRFGGQSMNSETSHDCVCMEPISEVTHTVPGCIDTVMQWQ